MKKVFDYKEAVKKVKNYQSKDKVIDLDCDAMNIIIRGDVKIVFWDYDRMSPILLQHRELHTTSTHVCASIALLNFLLLLEPLAQLLRFLMPQLHSLRIPQR